MRYYKRIKERIGYTLGQFYKTDCKHIWRYFEERNEWGMLAWTYKSYMAHEADFLVEITEKELFLEIL